MKPFPCENCNRNTRCRDVWAAKHFITHPGTIGSKNDGNIHYISHYDLVRLYNVPPNRAWKWDGMTIGIVNGIYNIHLYPNYQGDYDVVTVCQNQHGYNKGIVCKQNAEQ